MSELKTQPTQVSPAEFIRSIDHPTRAKDSEFLLGLFERLTGEKPVMWGSSIIGYGTYQYKTADGKTHSFMRSGFSPRKQNLSLYLMTGMNNDTKPALLDKLGKHKTGKSCLYVNKLADIDIDVLIELIKADWAQMQARYPE